MATIVNARDAMATTEKAIENTTIKVF